MSTRPAASRGWQALRSLLLGWGGLLALLLSHVCLAAVPAAPAALAPAPPAFDYAQAPKFALVVGNQQYAQWPALRNARADADLLAFTLNTLGFKVTTLHDANARSLQRALGELADATRQGGVAAVYFAGHGVQLDGHNYLVPVDAPGPTQTPAARRAAALLQVDTLIDSVRHGGAQLGLVLLDACRNDPDRAGETVRWRGAAVEGFAPSSLTLKGLTVVYATQPGERAQDGAEGHSPFATALARWLAVPGIRLNDALENIKRDVRAATRDEQRPWVDGSVVGDFALSPPGPVNTQLPGAASALSGSVARLVPDWFSTPEADRLTTLTRDITQRAHRLTVSDLPLLQHQARHGSVVAQAVLGTAWRTGFGAAQGGRRNARQARRWLSLAADQQMPYAINELGEMDFLGEGAAKDVLRARQRFTRAAAMGYPPASLNLLQVMAETGASP